MSELPRWVREILRCPQCRAEVVDVLAQDGPALRCTDPACGLTYRIEGGIPVMLVDDARRPRS
ncbi:MAG: hypothetical protein V9G08_12850 [Dermatophilaceae bacterium]